MIPDAVTDGQFTLHYQPLVDLGRDQIVGFEALARWRHPDYGTLQPDTFIGLAEETGAIGSLGAHLLRQACAVASSWAVIGGAHPFASVNLSPNQLVEPDLIDVVTAALNEAGLSPSSLQLELTEHPGTGIDRYAMRVLHQLADLGLKLALDDFGAGHSNLRRLAELPLYGIKLDWSLLHGSDRDLTDRHRAVLRAAIDLGHALGLQVTAEGVETAEEADLVRRLGCHVGQGWHFGRPVEYPSRL